MSSRRDAQTLARCLAYGAAQTARRIACCIACSTDLAAFANAQTALPKQRTVGLMQITTIAEPMRRRALFLTTLLGLSAVAACERAGAGAAVAPRAADAAASAASAPLKSLYSVVPESFRL